MVAKQRTAKKLIVLTYRQYLILEMLRAGHTTTAVMRRIAMVIIDDGGRPGFPNPRVMRRDTFYSHSLALRKKGATSEGRRGVKNSIKVLVKPHQYLVKDLYETPIAGSVTQWNNKLVVRLARQTLNDPEKKADSLQVLADALEDAGYDDQTVLNDLREGPPRQRFDADDVHPLPERGGRPVRPGYWREERDVWLAREKYVDLPERWRRFTKRLLERLASA